MIRIVRFTILFIMLTLAGFAVSAGPLLESDICYDCIPYEKKELKEATGERVKLCYKRACTTTDIKGSFQRFADGKLFLRLSNPEVKAKALEFGDNQIICRESDSEPDRFLLEPYKPSK